MSAQNDLSTDTLRLNLKAERSAYALRTSILRLIPLLEAEEAKFNHNHGRDGRFIASLTGVSSGKINVPQRTYLALQRSEIYANMNHSMLEGSPKRRTAFFGAASDVTSVGGLGGIEVTNALNVPLVTPDVSAALEDIGSKLYTEVNLPAYNALYDGMHVNGIADNLTGQALDYAMVHQEQTAVQNYKYNESGCP